MGVNLRIAQYNSFVRRSHIRKTPYFYVISTLTDRIHLSGARLKYTISPTSYFLAEIVVLTENELIAQKTLSRCRCIYLFCVYRHHRFFQSLYELPTIKFRNFSVGVFSPGFVLWDLVWFSNMKYWIFIFYLFCGELLYFFLLLFRSSFSKTIDILFGFQSDRFFIILVLFWNFDKWYNLSPLINQLVSIAHDRW